MEVIASWNGRLMRDGTLPLPLTDEVFLRGRGVFETIRAENGRPLLWDRHFARLRNAAGCFGWKLPGKDVLEEQIIEVTAANGLEQARVRITVGREILITAEPLVERPWWATAVSSTVPVNERSPLAGIKCTSYAENMWLLGEVEEDEVVRPNLRGDLCEGCVSNVFFVKNDRIHTPALDCGCLPGVMRAELLSCLSVEEGHWPIEVLREASEIWLTNATGRLRAVSRFDGRALDRDCPRFWEARTRLGLVGGDN